MLREEGSEGAGTPAISSPLSKCSSAPRRCQALPLQAAVPTAPHTAQQEIGVPRRPVGGLTQSPRWHGEGAGSKLSTSCPPSPPSSLLVLRGGRGGVLC